MLSLQGWPSRDAALEAHLALERHIELLRIALPGVDRVSDQAGRMAIADRRDGFDIGIAPFALPGQQRLLQLVVRQARGDQQERRAGKRLPDAGVDAGDLDCAVASKDTMLCPVTIRTPISRRRFWMCRYSCV